MVVEITHLEHLKEEAPFRPLLLVTHFRHRKARELPDSVRILTLEIFDAQPTGNRADSPIIHARV